MTSLDEVSGETLKAISKEIEQELKCNLDSLSDIRVRTTHTDH